MNPIAVDLGYIKIYWYSITMLTAILVGSIMVYKTLRKKGYSEDFITNLLFYGIICGIIGARIITFYLIFLIIYQIH